MLGRADATALAWANRIIRGEEEGKRRMGIIGSDAAECEVMVSLQEILSKSEFVASVLASIHSVALGLLHCNKNEIRRRTTN